MMGGVQSLVSLSGSSAVVHSSSDMELSVCRFSFNDFIMQDCVSHSYGVEMKPSSS